MHGNNPRKSLRKNINYLREQKAIIDRRSKHFQLKIESLQRIETNGSIEDCKSEAERFKEYAWQAFPEEQS